MYVCLCVCACVCVPVCARARVVCVCVRVLAELSHGNHTRTMEIHDERVKTKRAAPFIYSDLPLITHALFLFLSFSSHLALPLASWVSRSNPRPRFKATARIACESYCASRAPCCSPFHVVVQRIGRRLRGTTETARRRRPSPPPTARALPRHARRIKSSSERTTCSIHSARRPADGPRRRGRRRVPPTAEPRQGAHTEDTRNDRDGRGSGGGTKHRRGGASALCA